MWRRPAGIRISRYCRKLHGQISTQRRHQRDLHEDGDDDEDADDAMVADSRSRAASMVKGFTQKYSLDQVVYAEEFNYVHDAISREKQLKRWHRDWKINLIEENNPEWRDLLLSQWGLD